jgi:hypothetical protein
MSDADEDYVLTGVSSLRNDFLSHTTMAIFFSFLPLPLPFHTLTYTQVPAAAAGASA